MWWIILSVVLIAAGIALMLFIQKKDQPNVKIDESKGEKEKEKIVEKKPVERVRSFANLTIPGNMPEVVFYFGS